MKVIVFAASTLLAIGLSLPAQASGGDRIRFECEAQGAVDISIHARHEIIRSTIPNRRKFTTEFEAGPGTGFTAGSRLRVVVKGVHVGNMTLEPVAGGDVVGDINFDTRPQLDEKPFPANWPAGVGRGTRVQLFRGTSRVLGCTLD